jgi:hypothetical protein
MSARKLADEYENKLAGLVSDLRLATDYEDIYDTLTYLRNELLDMIDEVNQLWDESQRD